MTTDTSVKEAVRTFIREELEWSGPSEQLADDASLIDAGIIDSMSLLELAHWIGDRYHVKIDDTDIIAANFETLDLIEEFVQRGAKA